MVNASGNKVSVLYVEEATPGTTPGSPQTTILRAVGRNINLKKGALESQEVDASRQTVEVRQGFNQAVGDLGFELSSDSFNDPFRYLLGGATAAAWSLYTAVTNANGVAVTNATTITRTSGNWITDGYRPGDWIRGTNWTNAGNNSDVRIASITTTGATTIIIDSTTGTLVTEAAAATKQFQGIGKKISVGTVFKTVTLERAFTDIVEFQEFRGVTFNTMRLSARPGEMIGGSFGLLGMSGALNNATALTAVPTAANTNPPMAAFETSVYAGGALLPNVTGFDMLVDNQRSLLGVLGSKFSPDVFDGTCKVTGSFLSLFQNDTFMTLFESETPLFTMSMRAVDPNGAFLNFNVYRAKFTGHDMDPPQNGPVIQTIPWQGTIMGFSDGTTTFREMLRFQRSTVT
jgi:hypothetical protein